MYNASVSYALLTCILIQTEADKLKRMTVNGIPTKVVALGIGSGVNLGELNNIASTPVDRNVILVHDFSSLSDVEEQLRNTSCTPSVPGNILRLDFVIVRKSLMKLMLFSSKKCV